uniref:Uncharacterized protein n=1 Tax=Globodera rostochiensis TaxID=31243 RepID=A0A914HS41_GLORO
MEEFWILILFLFFATNSLDKANSVKVKLEETPIKPFEEIFGEGWWDKGEAEDLKMPPTNFGQNVHHQIDRQNTQIGQIEPNSTDQLGQLNAIQLISLDKLNPIQLISLDKLNPIQLIRILLSQSLITLIMPKMGKKIMLKTSENVKSSTNSTRKVFYEKEERKHLVEQFDQMKAELKRAGFKNSYQNELDKTVAKEFGLSDRTIQKWKRKLGQTKPIHKHSDSEQMELMKRYYAIKDQTSKISDEEIAKSNFIQILSMDILWKRILSNIQENENINSGSI